MNFKNDDLKKKYLKTIFVNSKKLSTVERFTLKLINKIKPLPPLDNLSLKELIKVMIEYQIAWLKNFSYLFNFKKNKKIKKIISDIDFEKRVNNFENVKLTIKTYSFRLGGDSAKKKILVIINKINKVNFKHILKFILKQTSHDPLSIVNWVKQNIIHVDSSPCVINKRPFNSLETLIIGIGQCTNNALLAGSLMQSAGYTVRYWSTRHHTFLEWWNPRTKSWQLEDSNFFPPEINIPRGLSISQFYDCSLLWMKIFETLPTRNMLSQFSVFIPEKSYGLSLLENNIINPNSFSNIKVPIKINDPQKHSIRTIEVEHIKKGKNNYLKIFNLKNERVLLIVINKKYPDVGITEKNVFINHNIFSYKSMPNYFKDMGDHKLQRMFFIIEANQKVIKKIEFFNTCFISVLIKDYENTLCDPFVLITIKINKIKEIIKNEKKEKNLSKNCQEIEIAYQKNYEINKYPKAIAFSKLMPLEKSINEFQTFNPNNIKGRVLDAGCGTGEFSMLMSQFADEIHAIDYTEERIKFFRDVIKYKNLKNTEKIKISKGSIEKTNFSNEYFDTVFCKGTIWQTNMKSTFREFFRILKPGGNIIFDFNTDAWNHYLMNDHQNKNRYRSGAETLYNSIWRRYSEISLKYYRKSMRRKKISQAKNFILQLTKNVSLEYLIKERNKILDNLKNSEVNYANKLELYTRLNLGESYLSKVLSDIFLNLLGLANGPSTSMSSESFEPDEIKDLAYEAGFSNYKYWIKDENKKIPNEFDSTNSDYFSLQYLGKIKTWNASLKKPF